MAKNNDIVDLSKIEQEIEECSKNLSNMLNELVGSEEDMKAIGKFKVLIGDTTNDKFKTDLQ